LRGYSPSIEAAPSSLADSPRKRRRHDRWLFVQIADADLRTESCPVMETTLHQQLKAHYAAAASDREVRVGRYRIDAVQGGRLIEIQLASLSGIRDKVTALLRDHDVTVVKPVIRRRFLVRRASDQGPVVDARWSPKRGNLLDVFHELLYFTRVFPHPRLKVEVPILDLEEDRVPCSRRRRRRWTVAYRVRDQRLREWFPGETLEFAHDLWRILPDKPAIPFDTHCLANALQIERWFAQRIAYCMRHCGAIIPLGKQGRSWLYEVAPTRDHGSPTTRGSRRRTAVA
ncbi:MAG TPA: hypothetical protein VIY86_08570, partial [Pirellulaceae bacterium]